VAIPIVGAALAGLGAALVWILRVILVRVFVVILAYCLYELFLTISDHILEGILNYISEEVNLSSTTMNITGISAWLCDCLRVTDCFSVIVSFLITKWFIKMSFGLIRFGS